MDSILITGAGGFLGRTLCHLFAHQQSIYGVDLVGVSTPIDNVEWYTVETDDGLVQLVKKLRPDVVIHAAFINRKPSDMTDLHYLDKILNTNLLLFECVAEIKGRLILVSSSAVYGNQGTNQYVDERISSRPVSLYGLAKMLQEAAAWFYSTRGLYLSIARLFNLSGPGQGLGMLLPDWVSQFQDFTRGEISEVRIRHKQGARDFVDVRDAAVAIKMMAEDFISGEIFNVCSGEVVSLSEIWDELQRLCSRPLKMIETDPNPGQTDIPSQRGSFDKIRSQYGWHPKIGWRQSLRDLWNSYQDFAE